MKIIEKKERLQPEDERELYHAMVRATPVVAWYSHAGGDCYGEEATVRGPCFRWFKVTAPKGNSPAHRIADDVDDANYCAVAMNMVPVLLSEIEYLRAAFRKLTHVTSENNWVRKIVLEALNEDKGSL